MKPANGVLLVLFLTAISQAAASDLPPAPDFQREFDYVAWCAKAAARRAGGDAYPDYAAFMPGLVGSTVDKAEWPEFSGMLTGKDWDDGPMPWVPAEHPEWEASYQRTRDVLKAFAKAARGKPSLVTRFERGGRAGTFAGLLQNIPFAQPAANIRQCGRGALEAGWRMEDGHISSKPLIAAFETNLRAANQLGAGILAIEHLVCLDIRRETYKHIRWAFAHEVLTAGDAKKLAAMLKKVDGDTIDIRRSLRGEGAIMLAALQYIYGPPRGGGRPQLNARRFGEVTGVTMGANTLALGARLTTDAKGTADAMLAMLGAFDRLMAPPYSTSKDSPIENEINKIKRLNKVTQMFPVAYWTTHYRMAMQRESQRRATHLLVELFAYRAKKGAWPEKLSSVGNSVLQRVGDDPFGDGPFVYRRTDAGPLLYSVHRDGKDDGGVDGGRMMITQDGTDRVYYPIPNGSKLIAAVKLKRMEQTKFTAVKDITAEMDGKTVTVAARVVGIETRPSRKYVRRYLMTLEQDGAEIILYYYEKMAKRLSKKQVIDAGMKVRAVADVKASKSGDVRLRLRDSDNLVVDE